MIRKLAAAAVVALSLSAGGLAVAQPAGGGAGVRQACQADFQKFCAGAGADRGARMQCMKGHAADLSSACKAAFAARMRAHGGQPSGQGAGQGGSPGQ